MDISETTNNKEKINHGKKGVFIDEYSYGVVEPEITDDFTDEQFFINIPKVQKLFVNIDVKKHENPLDLLSNIHSISHKSIPQNLYKAKQLNIVTLPDNEFDIGIILFDKIKGNDVITLGAWFQFDEKLENILMNQKEVWIVDGFSVENRVPLTRIDVS